MPVTALRPTIGLEVHVQLATGRKLFCGCRQDGGAPPNTCVCPVCLGYPGTLPVIDPAAVELAGRLALGLEAELQPRSTFHRKSYFYPDLPKGYQITQWDQPLARGGVLRTQEGSRAVPLRRLHLEEDAGKLIHLDGGSGDGAQCRVDFNRCGVPLVEVVTEPEVASPREAEDLLRALHRVLLHTGTSEGHLEEGSLRCDANVSLPGGGRVEVKNLNSFRHVRAALEAEIVRQGDLLEAGRRVGEETRGFDATRGRTFAQRGKEGAPDYRFLPEPDLSPIEIPPSRVDRLRATLPELPGPRRRRFAAEYGLDPEDASLLTATPHLAGYFETAAREARRESADPRAADPVPIATHLLRTELLHDFGRGAPAGSVPPAEHLGRLAARVADRTLSHTAAKRVLAEIRISGEAPAAAIARLDLAQVGDPHRLAAWIRAAMADHPDLVERYRNGEAPLLGFLVGQVMKGSGGRADPRRSREQLQRALGPCGTGSSTGSSTGHPSGTPVGPAGDPAGDPGADPTPDVR